MPVALLFLAAFCLFLAFPLEEFRGEVGAPMKPVARATAVAAAYGTLLTLAVQPQLPAVAAWLWATPSLAVGLHAVQVRVADLLLLGTGGTVPAYAVLALFSLGLILRLALRLPPPAVAA